MALIQCNLFSAVLKQKTELTVVIPTATDDVIWDKITYEYKNKPKVKALYLLHGAYGDHTDWIRNTKIELLAEAKNIAVIMPNAAMSFYTDMIHGGKYATYITEELPEFVQYLFPVSDKREDTFIAGLSMGGYGALKLALSKPEKYSAVASLSGVVDVDRFVRGNEEDMFDFRNAFGSDKYLKGSQYDLYELIRKVKKQNNSNIRTYLTCGVNDFLYEDNILFKKYLESIQYNHVFEEDIGGHDWDFWGKVIQKVIDWL